MSNTEDDENFILETMKKDKYTSHSWMMGIYEQEIKSNGEFSEALESLHEQGKVLYVSSDLHWFKERIRFNVEPTEDEKKRIIDDITRGINPNSSYFETHSVYLLPDTQIPTLLKAVNSTPFKKLRIIPDLNTICYYFY